MTNLIYYAGLENKTRHTASAKAPSDIETLCQKKSYQFLPIARPDTNLPDILQKAWKYQNSMKFWKNVLTTLKDGDILIYQHPLYVNYSLESYLDKIKKKNIRLIVLIHDLESLRKGIKGAVSNHEKFSNHFEGSILKQFDAVICHNDKMKAYLLQQGYHPEQLISLEIFDYLTNCEISENRKMENLSSIIIAGNLLREKSGYLYHIHENGQNPELTVNLYGISFDEAAASKNLVYHGSFPPDTLPDVMKGSFGLVWDGNSTDSCAGNTGEYLRYNNPHKTSLYLASGIPVIVWKEAAIADFVLKYQVGIVAENLNHLTDIIQTVTPEEYQKMLSNTQEIAKKLRSGFFFYQALEEAMQCIHN